MINEEMKKMRKMKFVIITAGVFLVLITAAISASARLAVKLTPDDKIGEDDPGEPKLRFPIPPDADSDDTDPGPKIPVDPIIPPKDDGNGLVAGPKISRDP
jgi:hypothetical protein